MTQALLWHHNGYQDVTNVTKEAAVIMASGHDFHSGWFKAVLLTIFSLYTPESTYVWYVLRHHDRTEIDTSISVTVMSTTTGEAHHNNLNLGINSYNKMQGYGANINIINSFDIFALFTWNICLEPSESYEYTI